MFDTRMSLKSNPLTSWYDKLMSKPSSSELATIKKDSHLMSAARGGGEGILTGAALAVVHANAPNGLDVSLKPGGTTVPVDAIVGAGGLLIGGQDAHNIGTAAAGVFSFRKTMDLMAEKKAQKGQKPIGTVGVPKTGVHGDFGEDPILREARGL
jgi:hypothetical protein